SLRESNLEVLEREFTDNLSLLRKLQKEPVSRENKNCLGTQPGETMSLHEHKAIVGNYESKCSTLTAANEELRQAYARVAEELECAHRQHSESIVSLESTTVPKRAYDELLSRLTQTQNIVGEYEKHFKQFQVGQCWFIGSAFKQQDLSPLPIGFDHHPVKQTQPFACRPTCSQNAYEEKMNEIEIKYSSLVEQAKYKRAVGNNHVDFVHFMTRTSQN
uniref:Coiled-coil domain-containing protein 78 n=1 Tax=Mesocestoides corti TaxID=53468 RepID=A0A5K3G2B4_MESCO